MTARDIRRTGWLGARPMQPFDSPYDGGAVEPSAGLRPARWLAVLAIFGLLLGIVAWVAAGTRAC